MCFSYSAPLINGGKKLSDREVHFSFHFLPKLKERTLFYFNRKEHTFASRKKERKK